MHRILFLLSLCLAACSGFAQTDTDDFPDEPSRAKTEAAYFRGRPLPECKEFWLLEERLEFRLNDDRAAYDKAPLNLALDVGHMFNLTSRYGIGGSFYFAGNNERFVQGIRLRYRHWLNRETALDISPGIIFTGDDQGLNAAKTKYPGFIISAALGYKDLVAFNITMERYALNQFNSPTNSHSETIYSAGFTLGSYPAIVGIVGTVMIGLIAAVHVRQYD